MEEKNVKYIYYGVVLIGAVLLLGLMFSNLVDLISSEAKIKEDMTGPDGTSPTPPNKPIPQGDSSSLENFAKCLTEKNAVLYGAYWCPHCKNQKNLFGDSVKYIKYVECQAADGGQTKECATAGIQAYPTWIINGQKYVGERSLEELASLTGCKLM